VVASLDIFLQHARKTNLQEVLRDRENKALAKRVMNVAWNDERLALGVEVVAWCRFVWSLQQLTVGAYLWNTETESHNGKYDVDNNFRKSTCWSHMTFIGETVCESLIISHESPASCLCSSWSKYSR
jgi:hypothetical protein